MEKIRDLLQALQRITSGFTGSLVVKDVNGKYLYVNETFARRLGRPPSELIGMSAADFFSQEIIQTARRTDREAFEKGLPIEFETKGKLLGKPFMGYVVKWPIYESSGKPFGVCLMSVSIEEKDTIIALRKKLNPLFGN